MPDDPLPLDPLNQTSRPAPALTALLSAWLGLLSVLAALLLPLLPGSRQPREELEHLRPLAWTDRFLPVPIYGSVLAIFLGMVVYRQMRHQPRPFARPLQAQRLQARVGISLGLAATAMVYLYVAWRGPRG